MNKETAKKEMTFFDHLEELRWRIVRSMGAIVLFATIAFCFKEFVFSEILFGPTKVDFWTYRLICKLSDNIQFIDVCIDVITYKIVNLEMTGQFMVHLTTSLAFGLVVAFPYIIWELWRFISPGLKEKEVKASRSVILFSSLLFFTGVLFGYFLLTPFSINFFATYQVDSSVQNTFSLTNYINFLTMFVLACGLMFELPVVVLLFAKIGIVNAPMMREYRKHALVVIMILSAIITPVDITTMVMVAVPIYVLYELSIFIAAFVNPVKSLPK